MDRGVVVGGALICASFLVAVWLNHSSRESDSTLVPTPPSAAEVNEHRGSCSPLLAAAPVPESNDNAQPDPSIEVVDCD
jgi:hypothetical protein